MTSVRVRRGSLHAKGRVEDLVWSGEGLVFAGPVLGFVSHKPAKEPMTHCLSNFRQGAGSPLYYEVLPSSAQGADFLAGSTLCSCSEEMIMLNKAALFGDEAVWDQVVVMASERGDPRRTKALGRAVERFDDGVWRRHLLSIAADAVVCKMTQDAEARSQLMGTGSRLLAEANANDCVWGVGLPMDAASLNDPREWRGSNVLGWALMSCRGVMQRRLIVFDDMLAAVERRDRRLRDARHRRD